MATGQAAGAMAVLSASTGLDPEELPVAGVHTLLREFGATVPAFRETDVDQMAASGG